MEVKMFKEIHLLISFLLSLLPDIVMNCHLPPLSLGTPPLFCLTTDEAKLLIGELKVLGNKEFLLWTLQPMVDVYQLPTVSYTHLRAHETLRYLVCRLLLEKKKT